MDFKVKQINWMGNIYQKFEAVCQEVDDIVGQDAVKYLENQVQNVGDSVKMFYSGVVHELLPLSTLASSTSYEADSVALKSNVGSSVKSVGGVVKDNNKRSAIEENPANNFMESLLDSNAIDIAKDQQAGAPIKHELVNRISGETCSDSLEVEDSYITEEEVDDSIETCGVEKENLHASIEETAIKSTPELRNLISVKEKEEPFEFSIGSESYSGSSDSACGVSMRTEENKEVNVEQNSHLVVDENNSNSSVAQVLNFTSLGEKESIEASLYSESSDVDEEDTGIVAEVSPAVSSVSCERPITTTEPLCFKSSSISDSPYSKSQGSYSFEIESCKNVGSSVKSVGGVKDDNKKGDEEIPANKSLQDSNAIDLAEDQQAGAPMKHELVNHISSETCSDSLEVEDSYITQEEVGDESIETWVEKENLHASIEETAIKSTPELMNLISIKEKEEPLYFSISSESYSGSYDSEYGVSVRTEENKEVNVEQNSRLIVDKNNVNSSVALTSLCEKESIEASLFSESSDVDEEDTGIVAEVSLAISSVSCERLITTTEPLCFKSSSIYDSPYSKSQGSYPFEIDSCKNDSGDVAWCVSVSSMVHVCCESPQVAGQVMESNDGLVSSGPCQSMESNDESLVHSIESGLEDIQLNDDVKLEESCVFVDDSELHAVACRTQKLRSYTKRIQDAFASKKRLAKEYERLAIWYGDADMEPSQGLSRTLLPFSSRTNMDTRNLQLQHASETEWELL